MAYNLYPGLKQILEDKRIRRFGIPDGEYDNYLKAEQFVVDCRNLEGKELDDLWATYGDLKEMGLEKPPYSHQIVHSLVLLENGQTNVASFFISNDYHYFMTEGIEHLRVVQKAYNEDASIRDTIQKGGALALERLVVMLATRNIIKEYKECKASQSVDVHGKPHKKGSGGYTLLRAPEAHEIGDVVGTHASPRPHFRRGHIRKLHPEDKTRWIFVSSCFVNGEPEVSRKAYLVA